MNWSWRDTDFCSTVKTVSSVKRSGILQWALTFQIYSLNWTPKALNFRRLTDTFFCDVYGYFHV